METLGPKEQVVCHKCAAKTEVSLNLLNLTSLQPNRCLIYTTVVDRMPHDD